MITKRIIKPSMINDDYKTVVTIEPTFEWDYASDMVHYPAAYVTVEYYVNEMKLLSRTTFKKILDETIPCSEIDLAVLVADEMINEDLSAVGLGGLCTLDIYRDLPVSSKPEDLDEDMMKDILYHSLRIPYDDPDRIIKPFINQTQDCFFDLEFRMYRIR